MKLLALEARQNGSYYQSRYEQVESLGADLYVLNGEGAPAAWAAERYRVASSQAIADIVAAARAWHEQQRFDGVLTFSEAAVVTVAAVAEALGLPGIGLEAARRSRNKLLMREAHARGGAAHPPFRFARTVDDALAAASAIGYPVILKPTLGAASNFVFRVDDPAALRERFAQAAEGIATMSWYAMEAEGIDLGPHGLLVEGFLDGRELLIDALIWDGEVFLGSIVDRVSVEGDTFDDDVHAAPASLDPEALAAVHRVVEAGARAQGLRRSALHAEVRFHAGAPFLLEIAVRPGGGGLDHMARVSSGYCPIRTVMDVARGVRPEVGHYRPTGSPHRRALPAVGRRPDPAHRRARRGRRLARGVLLQDHRTARRRDPAPAGRQRHPRLPGRDRRHRRGGAGHGDADGGQDRGRVGGGDMSESVMLVVGSGGRLYREYLLAGAAERRAVWLLDSAEPTWQRPHTVGASVVALLDRARLIPDAPRLVESAVRVAAERPVTGVFSYDETLVMATAQIAERLGLPGLTVEGADRCRDKRRTREVLTAAGVAQPRFAVGALT
jgi:biotin carboxylase